MKGGNANGLHIHAHNSIIIYYIIKTNDLLRKKNNKKQKWGEDSTQMLTYFDFAGVWNY